MKKSLHRRERPFLYERNGQVWPEETSVEGIVDAVNRGIQGEWEDTSPPGVILRLLHGWICRYIEEGATESFLNDLNSQLHHVQYFNYVVPPGFFADGGEEPESVFVANMNLHYSPEAFAAKEFSRFITYGMLKRIRRCQHPDCENIFLGPPQAKWCSPSCGSRYRVERKRKRDSE